LTKSFVWIYDAIGSEVIRIMNEHVSNVIVVTGATGGIGRAVVNQLLDAGLAVIGVGRDQVRCARAADELLDIHPTAQLAFKLADFSDQEQIRGLAGEIEAQIEAWEQPGLRGLVNNAGVFSFWQTLTSEGFDMQWAVNHLSHFLLTYKLLPLLMRAAHSRVVTVSSGSHYGTRLNWDDLQLMRKYNPLRAYKQTKLANVIFTAEINRRLGKDSSVKAYAVDPGLVDTDIGEKTGSGLARWIWSLRRRGGIRPEESARGIVHLLLNLDLGDDDAVYWKHGHPKKPNPFALDPEAGWRLWELSARMCGVPASLEAA
jgi:NAD(P)-dependent dehydrogenase (short-subunit alcohol dehydrogenase family)